MSMRRIMTALAGLTLASGLVAAPAGAGPQTKWFTDTVGPSTHPSYIVYPPSTAETLVLQITNDTSSNQSFGSADIDLVNGWSWSLPAPPTPWITTQTGVESDWMSVSGFDTTNNHLIHLRNDGVGSQYAIPPGKWLRIQLTFTTPSGGIDVPTFVIKQSNDFSDSSTRGTSNVFGQILPAAAIYVGSGPPAKLVYGQQPTDVQVSTSSTDQHIMCPPVTAKVEDIDNNVVSWLPSTAVTLSSPGSTLKLGSSTTLSANTDQGIATFGTGNTTDGCSAGLTASTQGGFAMTASTTVAAGAGYSGGTFSTDAINYTVYLTLCGATCNITLTGGQTNAGIQATGGDGTKIPAIALIGPAGTLPGGCVNGQINRPQQTQLLLDGHDKSVDIGWSKKVTLQDPRNGTPFWPVCLQGDYLVYVDDGLGGATLSNAKDGALLALCSASGVTQRPASENPGPDHACISDLYKNAASEHAVIWVPDQPGDPRAW